VDNPPKTVTAEVVAEELEGLTEWSFGGPINLDTFDPGQLPDATRFRFNLLTVDGVDLRYSGTITDPFSASTNEISARRFSSFSAEAAAMAAADVYEIRFNACEGSVSDLGPNNKILDIGANNFSGIVDDAVVGDRTELIISDGVDFSAATGIAGTALDSLVDVTARDFATGPLKETLVNAPVLESVNCDAVNLSGSLQGSGVFESPFRVLNANNTKLGLPDDLSAATTLSTLQLGRQRADKGGGHSNSEADAFVDTLHANRSVVDAGFTTDVTFESGPLFSPSCNTSKSRLQKVIGLRQYHPDAGGEGILDVIASYASYGLFTADVTGVPASDQVSFDVPRWDNGGLHTVKNGRLYSVTNTDGSGNVTSSIQTLIAGNQVRIDATDGTVLGLYEIDTDSATDNGDGTISVTLTIDTAPGDADARASIDSGVAASDVFTSLNIYQ